MSGFFDGSCQFSLMLGAGSSFFSGSDFCQTRKKTREQPRIFKVNFSYIFWAEITTHKPLLRSGNPKFKTLNSNFPMFQIVFGIWNFEH